MLATPNRLKKNADITRVYRQGKYGGGGVLSVKARRTGRPESRAVVVVGKKLDKRAVVRNRERRRVAAGLARLWAEVPRGYDIVVSVHAVTAELGGEQLDRLLARALLSAGVKEA